MIPNEQAKPVARKTDLVIQEVAGEVLVYDLKSHQAHCLNQTAAAIWKYCDGQQTVAGIARLLENEMKSAVDEASVWLAVQRLGKAQLLQERVPAPPGMPRVGRREAIRRLGIGSAIAVPVVMSILAPTAQAGCTNTSILNAPCSSSSGCCSGCCNGSSGTEGVCVNPSSVGLGGACNRSCACASGCCKSNGNAAQGQNTCVTSGGGNQCF